jgi:large repetitive protein
VHLRLYSFLFALFSCVAAVTAQTISSFDPTFGQPGVTSVTISGSGFLNATSVSFHGTPCPTGTWQVSDQSGTQIIAYVPSGATTGPITVTKPGGSGTSVDTFTVIGPGPYISDFSPTNAAVGTTVTINGAHFTGTTSVKFNGTAASFLSPTTDTQLNATVPAGATTGQITVANGSGSWVSSNYFYFPPGVTSFSSTNGRTGTNVVIKGTNFLGVSRVQFGGVNALVFTTNSNTQITATVPTNAVTGHISVSAPAGQFITTSNYIIVPNITDFTPIAGNIGTTVTINGANLNGSGLVVKFNGTTASVNSSSFGQISATVPSGATSGPLTVSTVDGTATGPTNFFLPPIALSISPTNGGPGTVVTITGNNFTNTTDVQFNNQSASTFTVVNNTTINATVPLGATTGQINIINPGGSVLTPQTFFVTPTITGFSPGAGVPGVVVNITGTNFLYALAVKFNGTPASFLAPTNDNLIVATVPLGATTGPITVQTHGGSVTTTNNFVIESLLLSITNLDASTVRVSWTTNAPGFVLQSSTNLISSDNWSNEPVAAQIIGGRETVTNSETVPQKYYRLRK